MIPSSFIFANWGPEQMTCKKEGIYTCKNCHLVIYCGQECQKSHWPHHIKFDLAADMVKTYDHIFARYMDKLKFRMTGNVIGVAMKEQHTIVQKWPYKLKLQPGQPGAQAEFDRLLMIGTSGKDRYVEWKKI